MRSYGSSGYYSLDPSDTAAYRRERDWEVAKGLQAVDGLRTSDYLEVLQADHVAGRISAAEASALVSDYYERKPDLAAGRGAEADLVAARIVEVVEAGGFSASPVFLRRVHAKLFKGLIAAPYDSSYRDFNIGKPEPVLAGMSVSHSDFHDFDGQLAYEFDRVRQKGLADVSLPGVEGLSGLFGLLSGVWQIHPFAEGNTRTVATFAVMCLRTLGFEVDSTPFSENSLYFRNALVRANYCNYPLGVQSTLEPLERFFDNALFGASHPLRNRDLYVDALYESKGLPLPSESFASLSSRRLGEAREKSASLNVRRGGGHQPGRSKEDLEL